MVNLSNEELLYRVYEFLKLHKFDTDERQQAQMWIRDFLGIFNIPREKINIGFEWKINIEGSPQKYADHLLNGVLLIEMKSRNKDLDKAKSQAFEYVMSLKDIDIPKYVMTCDFETIYLYDLNDTSKEWTFNVVELPQYIELFGFLQNNVTDVHIPENPVNEKAAKMMEVLHQQLLEANYPRPYADLLMTRIVFCMFADYSGIFKNNQFLRYLQIETREDGSDLVDKLSVLFKILNTPYKERTYQSQVLQDFSYINGGLFELDQLLGLALNSKIRSQLLETAKLDWSKISPVIFGSMFEGAMNEERRHNLGAHYTSEKNIMKVINSLFLNDLIEEFEHIKELKRGRKQKLEEFHNKLARLKFLDPACGSGNFLIVAYRELRRLEHLVVDEIVEGQMTFDMEDYLKVEVNQFYGIEIVPYAVSIAKVGLWLMDHLMNKEASDLFVKHYVRLPLHAGANIIEADALQIDWNIIIQATELNYILGNPPFIGRRNSEKKNIDAIAKLAPFINNIRSLDFVSGWYIKAVQMCELNENLKIALVSTNSVVQGLHAISLWPYIFEQGITINFAHQTFNWDNNGAHVHCVIIGFSRTNTDNKNIFSYDEINGEPLMKKVSSINEYLIEGQPILMKKKTKQMYGYPEIEQGSMPIDDGNFILSIEEADKLIDKYPILTDHIHNYVGGQELLRGVRRKVLYLKKLLPTEIKKMPEIIERVHKVKKYRQESKRKQTNEAADSPTYFAQDHVIEGDFLIIPQVSSSNREYIPMGYASYPTIVAAPTFQIPNASKFLFGILESKMHMAWVKIIGGKFKSDYRYSNQLVYNTFPFPDADEKEKRNVEQLVDGILEIRKYYIKEKKQKLADIYHKDYMPEDLREKHKKLDKVVEKLYRKEVFKSDIERVEYLIKINQKNISKCN